MNILVLAKAPVAGRVKTRLCPPCTPDQAAALARAALVDTLSAARSSGADRVVVALDGAPGRWLPAGVEVVDQGSGTLDRRLATAWSHVEGPTVQIGMDTPQVTAAVLDDALEAVAAGAGRAAIGHAEDGGWWALAMHRPDPSVFPGVPPSQRDTGRRQHERLAARGLVVDTLPVLRDVDHFDDTLAVASAAPTTGFARLVERLAPVSP